MGRKDRRQQARKAHANPPTRKPVKADRRVLIVLAVLAVVLVVGTYFARYSGAF